jgi:pyruvate dehydrogenase E2 component (dihydrolipoamide acetyltransferase)
VSTTQQVTVPDIGDFGDVPVIEVLVAPGDAVDVETPLVTLESDKATMDVPSPAKGVVSSVSVAVGDTVSEGSPILVLELAQGAPAATAPAPPADDGPASPPAAISASAPAPAAAPTSGSGSVVEVKVPDIGDFGDVPVIEVLVTPGDSVDVETPLVTLESDKATMDVPSPSAGTVVEVLVSVGDTVSQGSPVLTLAGAGTLPAPQAVPPTPAPPTPTPPGPESTAPTPVAAPAPAAAEPRTRAGRPSPTAEVAGEPARPRGRYHATPAVRRFARELGVDVALVTGTGRKGRILQDDVKRFVKHELSGPREAAAGGAGIPAIPAVDFAKYGEVEVRPLSRIKKISGAHLARAWLNVPHVTHHDEVDITELEAFRQSLKEEAAKQGVRVTMLTFVMKALTATLGEFPTVNASLATDGESLVFKRYFHIGIAVDTPNGLVVPVFRDVDRKGIFELAAELGEVSLRAREGKLKPDEMQGGCMSISSLGGIGGTAFTPIVNAPEVAILGLTRARLSPVWNGEAFVPRLMQPVDLSYDHRVIDGAEAARFVAHLGRMLADVRRLLL